MGKHADGKWGRGEGLEQRPSSKRQPKGAEFYKGVAKAICFFCQEQHLFMYPCGQLAEYQEKYKLEIRDPADISAK